MQATLKREKIVPLEKSTYMAEQQDYIPRYHKPYRASRRRIYRIWN